MRVEIRNLAEIGYVSTQEMIALVRELQSGYRPDLVLFYDGVNDTTSALLEGEADAHDQRDQPGPRIQSAAVAARLTAALARNLVGGSAFSGLPSRSEPVERGGQVRDPGRRPSEGRRLACRWCRPRLPG